MTFLNQELSSFLGFYSLNTSIVEEGRRDPETLEEIYNCLNNSWEDGTPLSFGGSGYNPNGGTPAAHAFPGHPENSDEWNMSFSNLPGGDQRGLGVTNIGTFNPGDVFTLDLAYSYHSRESESSYQLITPMTGEIVQLKGAYNIQFQTTCDRQEICIDDCVWPGDANADGIADYRDILEIGLAFSSEGPMRSSLFGWLPLYADDWDDSFINGTNFKHADCNGDGIVDESDFNKVTDQLFYNFTHDEYQANATCDEGDQLRIRKGFLGNEILDTLFIGQNDIIGVELDYADSLYGLAFELTFDTNYIELISLMGDFGIWSGDDSNEKISYIRDDENNPFVNSLDYASVKTNGENSLTVNERFLLLRLESRSDTPLSFSPTTQLQFKNVRAIRNDGSIVPFGGTTNEIHFEGLTATSQVSNQLPITLHPNPTLDKTYINFNGFNGQYLELIDTKGRIVSTILTKGLESFEFDLSTMTKGIYFLKVVGEKEFGTFKLIKL